MSSLDCLFWGYAVALCVHVVDEFNSNGGFVAWVRREYYPGYSDRKFFIANTSVFVLHVAFISAYEASGGALVVLPLLTASLFTGNGVAHWIYTLTKREHSPGLMTSPIYWILMYFIIRLHVLNGDIALTQFAGAALIGGALGIVSFYTFLITKLKRRGS